MRPLLTAMAALALGAGGALPTAVSAAPAAAQGDATRGLYTALRVCAACHGVAGRSPGPDEKAPPFATIQIRHDGASLRRRLREISVVGHKDMPPIPMTAREIEDVARYIETVPPLTPTAGARKPLA